MDRQDPTAPWPKFLSKGLQQPGGWKEQLSSYPQPCPLNICQCLLKTLYNKHPKALTFFCPLSKKLTLTSRRPETSRGVREQLRLRAIEEGGTDSSRFLFLVTLRDLAWTA